MTCTSRCLSYVIFLLFNHHRFSSLYWLTIEIQDMHRHTFFQGKKKQKTNKQLPLPHCSKKIQVNCCYVETLLSLWWNIYLKSPQFYIWHSNWRDHLVFSRTPTPPALHSCNVANHTHAYYVPISKRNTAYQHDQKRLKTFEAGDSYLMFYCKDWIPTAL